MSDDSDPFDDACIVLASDPGYEEHGVLRVDDEDWKAAQRVCRANIAEHRHDETPLTEDVLRASVQLAEKELADHKQRLAKQSAELNDYRQRYDRLRRAIEEAQVLTMDGFEFPNRLVFRTPEPRGRMGDVYKLVPLSVLEESC